MEQSTTQYEQATWNNERSPEELRERVSNRLASLMNVELDI